MISQQLPKTTKSSRKQQQKREAIIPEHKRKEANSMADKEIQGSSTMKQRNQTSRRFCYLQIGGWLSD